MSYAEKYIKVQEWWNTGRFHLAMAFKSPTELNYFLGGSLSAGTMDLLARARKKGMPFFVTPYYLSLLNTNTSGYDDAAIRSYILYSEELVDTYGRIKSWEKEDIVVAGQPNAAGWLLPEGHNIHRRYPEVAILIPDSKGRACGGLCASCQRMYDFQSERLNFDFEFLKPKETWDKKLRRLIRYERPLGKKLSGFLKENHLLFAATDRSVLNLPAIGKSMTFRTIGLTAEGKRILKFDHDAGRRHSPIIDRMGEVYIVENKSVAAYLRQLQDMGEDVREYISIWNYSEGVTEPRFSIYEFPVYPFDVTEKMTNLEL